MERRRFEDHLVAKPRPKGIDVATKLEHFAIITYAVDPERFEGVIPERFRLTYSGNRRTIQGLAFRRSVYGYRFQVGSVPIRQGPYGTNQLSDLC